MWTGLSQFSQLSVALIELGTGSVFDLHREQTFACYTRNGRSQNTVLLLELMNTWKTSGKKQCHRPSRCYRIIQIRFVAQQPLNMLSPEATWIRFSVFDLLGREIATLFEGNHPAGDHTIYWDGRDQVSHVVPSGMYFVKVETDEGHRIVHSLIKMP